MPVTSNKNMTSSWTTIQTFKILLCVQFSSVTQSFMTVCDPVECSMPGFPVHHHLLELAQTHVHRVSDATQPSHSLSSPFPPSIFPTVRVFSNESALWIRWPKYWSFSFSMSPSNEYSGLISFRMDWFDLLCGNFLPGTWKQWTWKNNTWTVSARTDNFISAVKPFYRSKEQRA